MLDSVYGISLEDVLKIKAVLNENALTVDELIKCLDHEEIKRLHVKKLELQKTSIDRQLGNLKDGK